ncbi:hypothetical protein TcWFU_009321 [Taenia crassiceps]|uniref:Uncharacterized protein n=1 Tax=Taenia crassiceps TaxID=6207 RepID=A0ABR4QIP4_9CEST
MHRVIPKTKNQVVAPLLFPPWQLVIGAVTNSVGQTTVDVVVSLAPHRSHSLITHIIIIAISLTCVFRVFACAELAHPPFHYSTRPLAQPPPPAPPPRVSALRLLLLLPLLLLLLPPCRLTSE